MDARYVIAAALSLRNEELSGEASPMDNDGARLVIRELEAHGFAITKTGDGAAVAAQSMGGSLPPAVPSSPADCPCTVLTDEGDCTACGQRWESQDDKQTCGMCGDQVYFLSTRGLCDGCEASPSTGPGPAVIGGQPGPDSAAAAATRPTPYVFELYRHVDKSGVSGTGVVAEGCMFTDGSVAVRWRGDHPATAVWPSLDDVLAVHGHQGATESRWISTDAPIDLWPAEGGTGAD